MGKIFLLGDYGENSKVLADMGNNNATLFYHIGEAIAEHYGVPSGINDDWGDDTHHIEEKEFCTFVSAIFAEPIDLAYSWARCAAGMYDVALDRRHIWSWNPEALPFKVFVPIYYGVTPSSENNEPEEEEEAEIEFKDENEVVLARGSESWARLFIGIAKACEHSNRALKFKTGLSDIQNQICAVNNDKFCKLVEGSVAGNSWWMYPWNRYAVGMYNRAKGEGRNWGWAPGGLPVRIYDYVYTGVEPPQSFNNEFISNTQRHDVWIVPEQNVSENHAN